MTDVVSAMAFLIFSFADWALIDELFALLVLRSCSSKTPSRKILCSLKSFSSPIRLANRLEGKSSSGIFTTPCLGATTRVSMALGVILDFFLLMTLATNYGLPITCRVTLTSFSSLTFSVSF